MSHKNIEVEIKTRLSKSTFDRLEKYLKKVAKFVKKSLHSDDYYMPYHRNFLAPKYPYEWLMLRKRDSRVQFCYKHWYPENTKNTTHCDELEIEVSDKFRLEKILVALNFKKFVTVEKVRLVFNYNNEFEIALDRVKKLGHFIEIEALKDFGGVKKTHQVVVNYAKTLGIKVITVPGGYAAELLRKKGSLA